MRRHHGIQRDEGLDRFLSEISDDPLDETVAKPGCFL